MEYGAIDLHLQRSHIRVVGEDGAVVVDRRIATSRTEFVAVFDGRARMRVRLETGTESEWVAQTLEGCGHEVVVADPNYTLMYGARARAVALARRLSRILYAMWRDGTDYRVPGPPPAVGTV